MKILLDECIPLRLKSKMSGFDVKTVNEMGWSGLKNSNLLKVSIENGFDIIITVDRNLQYQQNLKEYDISIVVFDVPINNIESLSRLLPSFKKLFNNIKKKTCYILS